MSDAVAFAEIFDRHYAAVHRFLATRWGKETGADLASETFLIAFDRRGQFDPSKPSARPWLFGIALNLSRMEARKRSRESTAVERGADRLQIEDFADSLVSMLDAQDLAVDLKLSAILSDLRPEDLAVLTLAVLGDFSRAEIADLLDIPIGTVKSRLHRTIALLRGHIGSRGTMQLNEYEVPDGER